MTFAPKVETVKKAPPHPVVKDVPPLVQRLIDMLRYRRPYGSGAEEAFIKRFIDPFNPVDFAGNRIVRVQHSDGRYSTTLFSCHTDTVHRKAGRQEVVYDPDLNVIYKDDDKPLGADDGAGVFIMLYMIERGVPGTYVFHRGEERGGIGSRLMAEHLRTWLSTYERAIAFDRRGTQDVITHQWGGRCCSEAFAQALAAALNDAEPSFSYAPCSSGVFTDTAHYAEIIPECTNISVGYEGEHTYAEMQDVGHLLALAEAACKIDWDSLPVARDPSKDDDDDLFYFRGVSLKKGSWEETLEDRYYDAERAAQDFFEALYSNKFDRAYTQLRYDEVINFYLDAKQEFEYLYFMIERGDCEPEDEDMIIDWVRGR